MANSWRKPKLSQPTANIRKYLLQGKFAEQIQAESVNFNQSSVKFARLSTARRFCAGDNTSKQSPTQHAKARTKNVYLNVMKQQMNI